MSNNPIQLALDDLTVIFKTADETLQGWSGEGNLQFPHLMGMLAVKLNWDEKQVREADPIVRYYVRKHPEWYVTRGAHGGIMRITDKQKKEQAKTTKSALKDQMKAAIEAKAAQTTQSATTDTSTSNDEVSDTE